MKSYRDSLKSLASKWGILHQFSCAKNNIEVEKCTVQLSSLTDIDKKGTIFSIWGYISDTGFTPKFVMRVR